MGSPGTAPPDSKDRKKVGPQGKYREPDRYRSQCKNNHLTEMCGGSEAGSYLRRIDSCITQLKAHGPSRTCDESTEDDDSGRFEAGAGLCHVLDQPRPDLTAPNTDQIGQKPAKVKPTPDPNREGWYTRGREGCHESRRISRDTYPES